MLVVTAKVFPKEEILAVVRLEGEKDVKGWRRVEHSTCPQSSNIWTCMCVEEEVYVKRRVVKINRKTFPESGH